MKKKIIKLLFLPLFLLQTNTYAQEKLYVGTDATEFPPFEYIENGEIKGFDIDLIKEIGKILNKEIVCKRQEFFVVFLAFSIVVKLAFQNASFLADLITPIH